jgi:hypothetical protein
VVSRPVHAAEPEVEAPRAPGGAAFWVGLVVGVGVMAYGVAGLLDNIEGELVSWLVIFVGADLLHDAVLAPVACAMAFGVARLVRSRWRAPLQAGLFASAVVLALSWIPLRGYGGDPDNPTVRPLDYATATVTALVLVWAAVAAVAAIAWWRASQR